MIKLRGKVSVQKLTGMVNIVPSGSGGGPLQSKVVYPSHEEQIVKPDDDFYGLSLVTVVATPRLPACVVNIASDVRNIVGPVVDIAAAVSVEYEDILFLHSVESVSGASYGFSKNSNGYYESTNKGRDSSYALCKVTLWAKEETTITLNCINYAESSYDYGLISEIDTMLTLDNTGDSTGVFKNFKGQSSSAVVPVVISIPAGNHYFCVKYVKDYSGSQNNDTFQFAIAE